MLLPYPSSVVVGDGFFDPVILILISRVVPSNADTVKLSFTLDPNDIR